MIDRRSMAAGMAGLLTAPMCIPALAQHGARLAPPPIVHTKPRTAVSFPKEIVTPEGGRIEFDARLHAGYGGALTTGGYDPHFFQIHDGISTFQMGFNDNDGVGNGGLVGAAGHTAYAGSGDDTYEQVFGEGLVTRWHHYAFRWDAHGLGQAERKILIDVDGRTTTVSWHLINGRDFIPLGHCAFNLITTAGPKFSKSGPVLMQNLQVFDRAGNLVLHNTLASVDDVQHSIVGPAGSFNGGGNARFVDAGPERGMVLMAHPVGGLSG